MDFKDTPEEAAFRAEARTWLEKNAEKYSAGETAPGTGAGDVANWQHFHVKVFALPEMPLERERRADLGAVNLPPDPQRARLVTPKTAQARR